MLYTHFIPYKHRYRAKKASEAKEESHKVDIKAADDI